MDGQTVGWVDERHRAWLERRFGSGAREWITGLGDLVAELCRRWNLHIDGSAPPGRTSVVLRCHRDDGTPCMLKISPDAGLVTAEARTLELWRDTGRVPAVLELDEHTGAALLEGIEPGHTIRSTGVLPHLERVAQLLTELHAVSVPPQQWQELSPLHSLVNYFFEQWEWRCAEGAAAEVVSVSLLHTGRARARDLTAETDGAVPLHGDLHPGNVLEGGTERGLVAIDPRGCAGEPAFDAVDWALWRAESLREVNERVAVLAAAIGRSEERLHEACRAMAPIAAAARLNNEGDVVSRAEVETLLTLAEA
ncbi:aminoglycoside phosphotransferase family protein [Lipingzhangella sp. LS1_29]|uniref:Aminoglycoside phosphotransferase family protein n=1 Tax=Lipingzhangella rawalii TaxID=2055835 RepID=A0ABU2HBG9_9ACTN|nr:aminoglycoside phosphotransferase family protein [Lipingzhangella rawalii]MDS1272175.1 aminoglycoside phosphotransferase family protein [Lipingzhangella rawalii]